MVASGLVVTMTNNLEADHHIEGITILPVEPEVIVPIGIAAVKKEYRSPAAGRFLEVLREQLKSG